MSKPDDIPERVRGIIADYLGHDIVTVGDNKSIIDDLGADSLDQVEVAMALEVEFDIELPDNDFESATTVGDVIKLVTGKVAP